MYMQSMCRFYRIRNVLQKSYLKKYTSGGIHWPPIKGLSLTLIKQLLPFIYFIDDHSCSYNQSKIYFLCHSKNVDDVCWKTTDNCCWLFRPAFVCFALQMLVKICTIHVIFHHFFWNLGKRVNNSKKQAWSTQYMIEIYNR